MNQPYDSHTHLNQHEHLPHYTHVVSSNNNDWEQITQLLSGPCPYFGSIGIHPWNVLLNMESVLSKLEMLLIRYPRCNIGEIGLDYSRDVPRNVQLDIFEKQLYLAKRLDRVVTIHSVQAWGDTIEVIKSVGIKNINIIFHGFRGSIEVAKQLKDHRIYFSLGEKQLLYLGRKQMAAIQELSLNQLLVESDGVGHAENCVKLLERIRGWHSEDIVESVNNTHLELFGHGNITLV